jgi:plastocyanin
MKGSVIAVATVAIAPTAVAVALGATSLKVSADPFKNAFNTKALTAKAGKVTIVMVNKGFTGHNVAIRAGTRASSKVIKQGPVVLRDGTSKITVTLKPGKYRFFCSFEGHEVSGMWGILTVK